MTVMQLNAHAILLHFKAAALLLKDLVRAAVSSDRSEHKQLLCLLHVQLPRSLPAAWHQQQMSFGSEASLELRARTDSHSWMDGGLSQVHADSGTTDGRGGISTRPDEPQISHGSSVRRPMGRRILQMPKSRYVARPGAWDGEGEAPPIGKLPSTSKLDSRDWTLRMRHHYRAQLADLTREAMAGQPVPGPVSTPSAAAPQSKRPHEAAAAAAAADNEVLVKPSRPLHLPLGTPSTAEDEAGFDAAARALRACKTIEQLDGAVRRHLHAFSDALVAKALDHLVKLSHRPTHRESFKPRGASAGTQGATADALMEVLLKGLMRSIQRNRELQDRRAQDGLPGAPNFAPEMRLAASGLNAVVKLNHYDDAFMQDFLANLSEQSFRRLHVMNARTLSSVLWALARLASMRQLRLPPETRLEELLKEACKAALEHLAGPEAPHRTWLSSMTWSLGVLRCKDEAMFTALAGAAKVHLRQQLQEPASVGSGTGSDLSELNYMHTSGICYGMAQANHYDDELMTLSGVLLLAWADSGVQVAPQAWSNYMWACGRLLHQNRDFLHRAAPHLTAFLPKVTVPQAVINCAWAYAVLHHYDEKLMDGVANWICQHHHYIRHSIEHSTVAWALFQTGQWEGGRRVIEATFDSAMAAFMRDSGTGQDGFQQLAVYGRSLLGIMPDRVDILVKVADLLSARLRYLQEVGIIDYILKEIDRQNLSQSSPLPARHLGKGADLRSRPLLGAAGRGLKKPDFMDDDEQRDMMGEESRRLMQVLPLVGAVGTGGFRSFSGPSHLGGDSAAAPSADEDKLLRTASRYWSDLACVVLMCKQLFQMHMELSDQGLSHLGLTGWQLDACEKMWKVNVDNPETSQYQTEVLSVIQSLGLPAQGEVLTPDGWFSIDILVQHPHWGRVAVEVDGPFHFFYNFPERFHGKALLRNRFLSRRVDKLVSINIDTEWVMCPPGARQDFVRQRLDQGTLLTAPGVGRRASRPAG